MARLKEGGEYERTHHESPNALPGSRKGPRGVSWKFLNAVTRQKGRPPVTIRANVKIEVVLALWQAQDRLILELGRRAGKAQEARDAQNTAELAAAIGPNPRWEELPVVGPNAAAAAGNAVNNITAGNANNNPGAGTTVTGAGAGPSNINAGTGHQAGSSKAKSGHGGADAGTKGDDEPGKHGDGGRGSLEVVEEEHQEGPRAADSDMHSQDPIPDQVAITLGPEKPAPGKPAPLPNATSLNSPAVEATATNPEPVETTTAVHEHTAHDARDDVNMEGTENDGLEAPTVPIMNKDLRDWKIERHGERNRAPLEVMWLAAARERLANGLPLREAADEETPKRSWILRLKVTVPKEMLARPQKRKETEVTEEPPKKRLRTTRAETVDVGEEDVPHPQAAQQDGNMMADGTDVDVELQQSLSEPDVAGSKLAEKIKVVQTVTIDPRKRKPATKPVAQALPVATRHSTRLRKPTAMVVDSSDEEEEDRRDESLEEVPRGESLKPMFLQMSTPPEGIEFAPPIAYFAEIDDSDVPYSDRFEVIIDAKKPGDRIVRNRVNVKGGIYVRNPLNAWIASQPRLCKFPVTVPAGDIGSASSMVHRLDYKKRGIRNKTVAFPTLDDDTTDEVIPYNLLNGQERLARDYLVKKKAREEAAKAGIKDFVFVQPADWDPRDPDYWDWTTSPEAMAMGGPAW